MLFSFERLLQRFVSGVLCCNYPVTKGGRWK
jgi:hypothetical protein